MKGKVVLLSGGLDSSVCLWLARQQGPVVAVNVDYGQQAARTEQRMSIALAHRVEASYRFVDMREVGTMLASSLTGGTDSPVVPGRNGLLLSVAAGIAATAHADEVWIGCNSTDADLFPDCRSEFLYAMSEALYSAYGVEVRAPLLAKTKVQVVELARSLGVPMSAVTTCYRGTDCGECRACRVMTAAIEAADFLSRIS